MKSLTKIIICILLLYLSVLAQNYKTDTETDGLKGSVKTVLSERATLKKGSRKLAETKRKMEEAITYDSIGNRLTWKSYDFLTGTLFDSVKYSRLDGDKIAIYEEVENPNKIVQINSAPSVKTERPFDPRYNYKFKYKFDGDGNVSEEAWYRSNGSLWIKYTYNFKGNQREELVYDEKDMLNQKYVYTLDGKGNEIEMLSYDTEKNKIDGKETYEYLEFDTKGNWTRKLTSEGDEKSKFVVKPREIIYRTIAYF